MYQRSSPSRAEIYLTWWFQSHLQPLPPSWAPELPIKLRSRHLSCIRNWTLSFPRAVSPVFSLLCRNRCLYQLDYWSWTFTPTKTLVKHWDSPAWDLSPHPTAFHLDSCLFLSTRYSVKIGWALVACSSLFSPALAPDRAGNKGPQ